MPFCSPIRYFAAMNLLLPTPQSKRICKVRTHKTWRFSQTHSENGKIPSSQSPQADHPTNMKKLMYDYKTTHWKSTCRFSLQLISVVFMKLDKYIWMD